MGRCPCQPGSARRRWCDHRADRALRGGRVPRRARCDAVGGKLPSAAAAARPYPETGTAGSDSAARHTLCGRPGGDGGGADRARADLRGRLPPCQLRVSPEAFGPPGAGGRPGGGQQWRGVGARRRHRKLFRRNFAFGAGRSDRATGVGQADVEAAAMLASSRDLRGRSRLPARGRDSAGLADFTVARQYRVARSR